MGKPTLTFDTGAGTGAVGDTAGEDATGIISIITGTNPAGMAIVCTATYNEPYQAAPTEILLTPASPEAAELDIGQVWVPPSEISANGFSIEAPNQALSGSTPYSWYYKVVL